MKISWHYNLGDIRDSELVGQAATLRILGGFAGVDFGEAIVELLAGFFYISINFIDITIG